MTVLTHRHGIPNPIQLRLNTFRGPRRVDGIGFGAPFW